MAVLDDTGYSFYGRRESSWFIQNVFAFTSEYVHNTEPWRSQHAKKLLIKSTALILKLKLETSDVMTSGE